MYIATILTLFLGLAAAAPGAAAPRAAPSKVKINGISLLGTGCPPGSADVQVDATGTLFEATFSAYEVQTGPDTKASDWRKNCKLTMNMEFDSGFQYVEDVQAHPYTCILIHSLTAHYQVYHP
jgi:hypothetical protein